MFWRFVLAALAVGVAIFSAAVTSFSVQSSGRRALHIGVPGLPDTIEPGTALEGAGALVARQVFDTLVAYQEASTDIEPALATRWTVSREGLLWSFTLRDNVRFHDGKALTAADVVASLERPLKVGTKPAAAVWVALLRGAPGVIREVRAADTPTVQILLAQPYAPLLTVLALPGFAV